MIPPDAYYIYYTPKTGNQRERQEQFCSKDRKYTNAPIIKNGSTKQHNNKKPAMNQTYPDLGLALFSFRTYRNGYIHCISSGCHRHGNGGRHKLVYSIHLLLQEFQWHTAGQNA